MPSGVRVRLPPWAPKRACIHTLLVPATHTVHIISPDEIALGNLKIPESDRLCCVVIRIKDYTSSLAKAERQYANSVSEVRRKQYSSGRRAVQLGLSSFKVTEIPILFDDRKPSWPVSIVGSIAHSHSLAVALVGFKQDFRGVGIDILPKRAVSDKVRERILLDEELRVVLEGGDKDLQTMFFCAKESIYKASNPETDEFLAFKDVCVRWNQSGTEYSGETVSKKQSSELVARGRGYIFEVEHHWLTIFLIRYPPRLSQTKTSKLVRN